MDLIGEKTRNSYSYDSLQTFRDAFYPKLESNEHFKNGGKMMWTKECA